MGSLLSQSPTPFASLHAIDSEQNEGNTEQLAHIEEHTLLESYLILLGVLNEDTTGIFEMVFNIHPIETDQILLNCILV